MVSQSEIAKHLKVSQRTVSLCLAGSSRVTDRTRRRVVEAATEMGYRPNRSAVSMRTGRFNAIALLQSTRRGFSYMPQLLLSSIQDALVEQQMHLVLSRVPDAQFADETYLPSILREWAVDGFLLNYTYGVSPEVMKVIEGGHLPTIWLNSKRESDCVYPDDIDAGRMITQRLLELGHRRIAFFTNRPFEEHYSVSDRYQGYAAAMAGAGLSPRKLVHADKEFKKVEEGFRFVREFLKAEDRPTAIVAYETFEAARVLYSAFQLGLSVPGDLSLATFHETDSAYFGFPITTAQIPEVRMGTLAVESLLRRMQHPDERMPAQAIPFTDITGASVAPPEI